MENFKTKMALLGFIFFLAACTTPFVEVTVNGEGFTEQDGSGGCGFPCYCPTCGGGAKFRSDKGHEAKILRVEEGQTVYTLLDGEGNTIRVINPQVKGNPKADDPVHIKKMAPYGL